MNNYVIFTETIIQNHFKVKANSEEEALKNAKVLTQNKEIFGYDLLNNSVKLIKYDVRLLTSKNLCRKGKIKPLLEDLVFDEKEY